MTRSIARPTGDGDLELKVRYVRNAAFWGLPYGTPIRPGMKPTGEIAKRLEAEGKPVRDDVGVVEVKPKKDGSLRVKPKARGKRKFTPEKRGVAIGSLMREGLSGGDAEDVHDDDYTDEEGNGGNVLDLMIENGITPAELDESLRDADWDDGRVGDSGDRGDQIDRYIDDTIATYRQKYTAALVAQNDDGKDDVEPEGEGDAASDAPQAETPPTAAEAPAAPQAETPAAAEAAATPAAPEVAAGSKVDPAATRQRVQSNRGQAEWIASATDEELRAELANASAQQMNVGNSVVSDGRTHVKFNAHRKAIEREQARRAKGGAVAPKVDIDKVRGFVEKSPQPARAGSIAATALYPTLDRDSRSATDYDIARLARGEEPATPLDDARRQRLTEVADVIEQTGVDLGDSGDFVRRLRGEETDGAPAPEASGPEIPEGGAAPAGPRTVDDLLNLRGNAVTTKLVPAQVSAIRAATPAQRAAWAEEAGAKLDTIYALGQETGNKSMYLNGLVDALKREPGAIAVDAMLESRSNKERNALLAELDATDLAAATKENDERLALLRQRARPAERPGLNRREKLAALLAKATAEAETSATATPEATDLDAPAADIPDVPPTPETPAEGTPYVATGNMNAPETMTPEQLDAEIAAAKELQAELRRRKVPSNSAQLADAKMRQKVFEDQKRINARDSAAAEPSTPDVPEAPPAGSTVDAEQVATGESGSATPPDEQRVRDAVAKLATRPGAWVNLTRLRDELPDVGRDELDKTLLDMASRDDVYIIPEANQKTLTEEDRDNALFIGGEDRHLISIDTPSEPVADTPDVPGTPEGDAPTPDALTLPDGRTMPRDTLDEQEAQFLTDRWTLRDADGRVQATVERDTDGDYTWSVIGEDGQARNGYGARTPEDAQDRLAEQLGALPADGEAPAEDFGPDQTISTDEIAQADGVSLDASGLIEADDGELEVSEEVGARQDRVEELLTGTPDLTALDDGALGETRRDVVDELRLQEEIARRDRQRGTTAPAADAEAAPAPAAEGDTVDTTPAETVAEVEPAGPKPRPGVAGAAEDLADAVDGGDPATIQAARTRLDSSLRRSRSDSPIVAELRTMLDADGDLDAGALRDIAERLRVEAREKRNAGARSRRLAKRLERERLRSLLGEIDAEMRTRNLNPDEYGGPAPRADGTVAEVAAPEPDDTIGAADLAQANDLGADDGTIAPEEVAAAQELGAAPAVEPTPEAAPARIPRTYGDLQPGDVYPSPENGEPITVDQVVPQAGGDRVEVSGSTARGREWNLLPASGAIPGAPPADEPVTIRATPPEAPGFAIPPAPTAEAPAAPERPLPDTPLNRIRQARPGEKLRARAATGETLEFEVLGTPNDTTAETLGTAGGANNGIIAVDARSNTLGEGRLDAFTSWDGTEELLFVPDRDGREIRLSPTSLERADGLVAPTSPEGTYRETTTGQSVVEGRNYVGGIRQASPRRWAWTAELYGPDGTLITANGGVAKSPEEAQRAVRDLVEGGYLGSAAHGNRIPEGETLPQIPERAAAPVPRSVSVPDAPPAYAGPVNAVTGRPDYTEPPELLPRAIETPRAGWSPEEIRAGIAANGERGTATADAINWDSVIVAPGGGLMAYKPLRPGPGETGYKIALTENGATFTTGGMSLDKPVAVSMLNTLTRGVTPGGRQIDWGVSTRTPEGGGGNEIRRELERAFPDQDNGEGGAIKFALSKVIADKVAKNQASSATVRNAKSVFGILKPDHAEYPNARDADRAILDNIGGLKLFLKDGKRERSSYAQDLRTDAEIKDDGETIRVAQGADALFDLGAPDKAIALIERRIDELEQIYGTSGYDSTGDGASTRGSIMLRRTADAMRQAYDPEPVGMAALRAAEPGDRIMTASPGSATGRRIYRVKHNVTDPNRGKDRRILTVVEEGTAGGRDQRMSITEQGMQADDFGAEKGFRNKNVVRLAPNEPAPEGVEAVNDRIGRRTPMPALDDAVAAARANLDAAFGPITREQPTRAPKAAKRTKAGDADRSAVVDRPGAAEAVGMDPDVADRILRIQGDLMEARVGADFTLLDTAPSFGVHQKVSDVKGTWGEGNKRNDDPEFWRTARLSAGGAFVTGKDGSIYHAETGALMSSSLADQATADRVASYLERLVNPDTGQAYDWNDPAAVSRTIRETNLRAVAADPDNPTRAEQIEAADLNPLVGVRKQAEIDELVARGPGAPRKATVPVQAQSDRTDYDGHRPNIAVAPFVEATGVEPGRKGDYADAASGKNADKLAGIVTWARTLAPVRPYDTIAGLRAAADKHRDDKITRNVRGKRESSYDAAPVVERPETTMGAVLDAMAAALERDVDPEQWTEMEKLNRAGGSGDLKVTGAKVEAQELASGRGTDENSAYAQRIADAIKANGVRLDWVDQNTYRSAYAGPIPPHYRLAVPGVPGVGDYRDEATGDLVIEQIDQHNKGVQMDKDGNVTASWRTYAPDGTDLAETIMTLRFDNGQWTFVEKDTPESDGPEAPAPQDLDALTQENA